MCLISDCKKVSQSICGPFSLLKGNCNFLHVSSRSSASLSILKRPWDLTCPTAGPKPGRSSSWPSSSSWTSNSSAEAISSNSGQTTSKLSLLHHIIRSFAISNSLAKGGIDKRHISRIRVSFDSLSQVSTVKFSVVASHFSARKVLQALSLHIPTLCHHNKTNAKAT